MVAPMSGCGGCGCKPAIEIVQGDAYLSTDGRALCFDSRGCSHWPDGMTAVRLALDPVAGGCSPCGGPPPTVMIDGDLSVDDCGVRRACFDLSCSVTAHLPMGKHAVNFRVIGQSANGAKITLERGWLDVR